MMKNRIVCLTTGVFALFALAGSYGVCATAKDATTTTKSASHSKGRSKSRFSVKIDKSGDLEKYKQAAKELLGKIKAEIKPDTKNKVKKAALKQILRIANKAGTYKFDQPAHYAAAKDFMAEVVALAPSFNDKNITNALKRAQKKLSDPEELKKRAKKLEKSLEARKAKKSAAKS